VLDRFFRKRLQGLAEVRSESEKSKQMCGTEHRFQAVHRIFGASQGSRGETFESEEAGLNVEGQMDKHDVESRDRSNNCKVLGKVEDRVQYLLSAEEQLLQSISARAPLPEVLNGICSALDGQIDNVVSLIFLPGDDASELAEIGMNAELFGLHTFCSEGVFTENDELLGALEMYSSVPRIPSASEVQLIERAACLAALAIQRDLEADHHAPIRIQAKLPLRRKMRTGLEYVN
jgi:hypothetical protein